MHQLKEVDREQWGMTTAAEAMTPLSRIEYVSPETGLWDALQKMGRDGVNQLPVLSGGRIEGMLRRDDVIGFLRTLEELHA
jgi:CBS domain-containing protein